MEARAIRQLLAKNPHPHRYTLGMFYREKMSALASIIPDMKAEGMDVLDVGGGMSSLCSLIFPGANITNVDNDPTLQEAWPWMDTSTRLVPGSATDLSFEAESFDCVTGFDVLEHIPDDHLAAAEMQRVVKPDGCIIVSTPTEHWRHPYHSLGFKRICYREDEVMAQWGHVRRGYREDEILAMFKDCRRIGVTEYQNPLTSIACDLTFSKLSVGWKRGLLLLQYPLFYLGHGLGFPGARLSRAMVFRK